MRVAGSRRGFSIVEVLVVIAVIAVISAIVFAVAKATVGRAKATSCTARLANFGKATDLYAVDYNDVMPPQLWHPMERQGAKVKEHLAALRPYGFEPSEAFCGLDSRAHTNTMAESCGVTHLDTSYCTTLRASVLHAVEVDGEWVRQLSKTQIEKTAELILLLDMMHDTPERFWESGHGRFGNLLYADGHVQLKPLGRSVVGL